MNLYSYIQNLIQVVAIPAARVEGRIEVALKEHVEILDAIEAQDLDLALSRLKFHLESVKEILLRAYSRKDNSKVTKDL